MREREREREAETQAEGEAGSMQGARRGTQSWVPRITPWTEDGAKLLSHPGCPKRRILKDKKLNEESCRERVSLKVHLLKPDIDDGCTTL